MKAMAIANFGGPEVFAEREVDKPTASENEVLVKVYAASVFFCLNLVFTPNPI
jgi:NADPH:quinone reductase-like Zn-dependent oxidoreductase